MKKQTRRFNDTQPLYVLSAIIFACSLGLLAWFFMRGSAGAAVENNQTQTEKPEAIDEADCEFRRALDGVCVGSEEEQYPRIVAVMIENHPDARPQSGLRDAAVVYEAPVEANYSRFMALYPIDTEAKKVGPVRSARPYYLNWAQEYGAPMYMHVGGSPDALKKIAADDIFDMDEFYRGWYFWRSADRYAPHNTYTSRELWQKAWNDYGKNKETSGFAAWKFSEAPLGACEANCATTITASFLSPTYEAVWQYTTGTRQYTRFQMGKPHLDQTGEPIIADTVVVQKVTTDVLDAVGRIAMDTVGSGEAIIFRDGHAIRGTWKKDSVSARTIWRDADGDDIPLKPGHIWIEVVNQAGKAMYK